jgi:phage terminase Nu1 subunit (DNA packaging protein)
MKNGSKKPKAEAVGKADLAVALGWTRPRLDRRLDQDPNFPVKKRGTRAGGWEFDLQEVLEYLGQPADGSAGAPQARPSSPDATGRSPGRHKLARTAAAARDSHGHAAPGVHHHGEQTAAQRLKNAQAAQAEDKLRLSRRELVEAEEMRMVLGTMLAHLGKGLDGLPDTIVRRYGLQEETGEGIRGLVDELRRNMVADLQALLAA